MRLKHILLLVSVCLLAVSLLRGQAAPPADEPEFRIANQEYVPQDPHAIRVQTTMVEVNVVVRDAKGKTISGLKREDFKVYDQGRQQKISSFIAELAHPPVVPPPAVAEAAATPPPPPPTVPPATGEPALRVVVHVPGRSM